MNEVSNPERFTIIVQYADGVSDAMFPICVGSGEYEVVADPQVYCLTNLRDAEIERIRVRNRMSTAYFVVGAVTANMADAATVAPHIAALPPSPPTDEPPAATPRITVTDDGGVVIGNGLMTMTLRVGDGIIVESIDNQCTGEGEMAIAPGPIFEIGDAETLISSERVTTGDPILSPPGDEGSRTVRIPVDGRPAGVPLRGELVCSVDDSPGIAMRLNLVQSEAGTPSGCRCIQPENRRRPGAAHA
jgi:hypothetical protein